MSNFDRWQWLVSCGWRGDAAFRLLTLMQRDGLRPCDARRVVEAS